MMGLSGLSGLSGLWGGLPAFAPSDIAGLSLWTIGDAVAGADGAAVATAPGSGGKPDLTQATGANQPIKKTNILNGHTIMRFDGSNDYLENVVFAIGQPSTWFVVAKIMQVFGDCVAAITGNLNIYSGGATGALALYAGTQQLGPVPILGEWHILSVVFNGASTVAYKDGVSEISANPGSGVMTGIRVGLLVGGTAPLLGDMAEVLAYTGALSTVNRQAVENYLSAKYGLPIAYTKTFAAADLFDNGYSTNQTNYFQSSPLARAKYTTTATQALLRVYTTIFATYPADAQVACYVNGVLSSVKTCTATGINDFVFTLPGGSKTVEFIAGPQSSGSPVIGTFLVRLALDDASAALTAPSATTSRVVVYGDSISNGHGATNPVSDGWDVLLRQHVQVVIEGWSNRSLWDDANTGGLRAALVAQIASFASNVIWLAIGTNDYGLNKWSAASFGTAYAALLDDLHTARPAATIYCQTPLVRTVEVANSFGNTLGNYRTQIATAQSTRSAYAVLVDGTAILTTGDLADGIHPTTAGYATYYLSVKATLGL